MYLFNTGKHNLQSHLKVASHADENPEICDGLGISQYGFASCRDLNRNEASFFKLLDTGKCIAHEGQREIDAEMKGKIPT